MTSPVENPRSTYARFTKTPWTLIQQVRELPEPDRAELLDQLLRQYWKPLYAFFRAKGQSPSDSEDLVQGFLLKKVVEKDFLKNVESAKGRFRTYLMVCANRYLIDQLRPDMGLNTISFDQLRAEEGDPYEPSGGQDPAAAYWRVWRLNILERAIRRVKEECQTDGNEVAFLIFCIYYMIEAHPHPTWKDLADRYGLEDAKAASRKADLVKRRLIRAIWDEIRQTVYTDEEVEEEILSLLEHIESPFDEDLP